MDYHRLRGTNDNLSQSLVTDAGATSIHDVLHIIKTLGLRWCIKLFFTYLGNPIVFVVYWIFCEALHIEKIGKWETFTKPSTNVKKMNLWLYLAITLPAYVVWIVFESMLMSCAFSNFSPMRFLEYTVSWCSLIASIFGIIHLFVWTSGGMEGNILGFIFFLPLLLCSLVYIFLWLMATLYACGLKEYYGYILVLSLLICSFMYMSIWFVPPLFAGRHRV